MSADPWPLRHLVLRTPRLVLRPDDDAGLFELAEEARLGIHPPEYMPFVTPWTDDSPENRLLLAELLRSAGCRVIEASDGDEALARWRSESPDLIFMDLRMQGLNGKEAIRRIRAEEAGRSGRTRVVVLSASAFEHERLEALGLGADAFLSKPFRDEEIFAQLEALLGIRFAREESKAAPAGGDADALTPERVSSLPADLRRRLSEAAAGGESDALQVLAAQVADHDAAMGARLAALVRSYRFDEIEAVLAMSGREREGDVA